MRVTSCQSSDSPWLCCPIAGLSHLVSGHVSCHLVENCLELNGILKPGWASTASAFKGFVLAGSGRVKLSCNCLGAAGAVVHLGISTESLDTSLWSYFSQLGCQIGVREKGRKTVFKWAEGGRSGAGQSQQRRQSRSQRVQRSDMQECVGGNRGARVEKRWGGRSRCRCCAVWLWIRMLTMKWTSPPQNWLHAQESIARLQCAERREAGSGAGVPVPLPGKWESSMRLPCCCCSDTFSKMCNQKMCWSTLPWLWEHNNLLIHRTSNVS